MGKKVTKKKSAGKNKGGKFVVIVESPAKAKEKDGETPENTGTPPDET